MVVIFQSVIIITEHRRLMFIYIHTHIYEHAYIYIHTYTHTHMDTYIPP